MPFIYQQIFRTYFRAKFSPGFQPTDEAASIFNTPISEPPDDGKPSLPPPSPEEAKRIISNFLPRYILSFLFFNQHGDGIYAKL